MPRMDRVKAPGDEYDSFHADIYLHEIFYQLKSGVFKTRCAQFNDITQLPLFDV